MSAWPLIAARFAVYVDLALLFGVPLFGLYALKGSERHRLLPSRSLIAFLALFGLALSSVGFLLMAASMAGTGIGGVDRSILNMLLTDTPVGWAYQIMTAALLLAFAGAVAISRRPVAVLALGSAAGATAVATLAWSGHAAATEGNAGTIHLLADILHLLAAGAWLGALLGLTLLLWQAPRNPDEAMLRTAYRALAGFSLVGSIIVGLIVATGLINGALLVGLANLMHLTTSLYGQVLLAKLLLFALMLTFAVANRFRLTPRLGAAISRGAPGEAISELRRSVMLEMATAILVLAIVAWLGTLAPPLSDG
ncbi:MULTISPECIES: copper homeostasis membrane protein CopD [unclassified Sphingobium]|uniref:copper homeostasis membrane protein CopD n=1 Tax=unclassified Sphingobium TaxID=2611147 RepID=UPI000451B131|nr:copper homeostasis membrane protein CopD [Sphingobium sp. Ant17]EXS70511.1 copper resistance protein CopD [Sphingobium sp. Ant17]